MALSLKIISYKGGPLAEPKFVTFESGGGSIGRSDDNTLVLPDPDKFVSRHHASISFENGSYYLTDSSLGGVFINNSESPLNNGTEQLHNGTRLKIGEYEIETIISEESKLEDFPFSDIFAESPSKPVGSDELLPPAFETEPNPLLGDNESPFARHEELIETGEESVPEFESHLEGHVSPLFDSYSAPEIETKPASFEDIPENLSFEDLFGENDAFFGNREKPGKPSSSPEESPAQEFSTPSNAEYAEPFPESPVSEPAGSPDLESILATESARPEPNKIPVEQPVQHVSDSALFDRFLQGAGLERTDIKSENLPDTMQRIGHMFRQFVAGTVSVLRSRAEFKSLFRVNVTVIRAANNNPLKFAVSTDDVLKQLIQNKEGGFLESVESIEQGFNDIMNHQLAMQAGIQASLTELLKRFDPKTIEKQFEQGIVLQKKAKCWDSYQDTYRIESEEAVENFFGDAFVEAYEDQMKALTEARNKNSKFEL